MLYNAGNVNIKVSVSFKTNESSVNKENKQKISMRSLFLFLSLNGKSMQHYYVLDLQHHIKIARKHIRTFWHSLTKCQNKCLI